MGDVDWDIVNSWVLPAVVNERDLVGAACAFDNDLVVPAGRPRRGGRGHSHEIDPGRLHACHPLVQAQRRFWAARPSIDRGVAQPADAPPWLTHAVPRPRAGSLHNSQSLEFWRRASCCNAPWYSMESHARATLVCRSGRAESGSSGG
jgi:hypothetical protein